MGRPVLPASSYACARGLTIGNVKEFGGSALGWNVNWLQKLKRTVLAWVDRCWKCGCYGPRQWETFLPCP